MFRKKGQRYIKAMRQYELLSSGLDQQGLMLHLFNSTLQLLHHWYCHT